MRSLTAFAVCAMLATAAQAQTPPPTATAPTPAAPAPAAPAAPAPPTLTARPITPPTSSRHMTLAQRFDAANTTHDGHLTSAQAKAGHMNAVYRDFSQIDTANRGYVTLDDIRLHNRARAHAARSHTTTPAAPSTATE